MKKQLILPEADYYRTHLAIINGVLPAKLTNREMDVLAGFMRLKGDIKDNPFSTSGRKIVRDRLGITGSNLSNLLRSLKQKQIVTGKHPSLCW